MKLDSVRSSFGAWGLMRFSPIKMLPACSIIAIQPPTTNIHHDQRRTGLQQCRTATIDKVLHAAGNFNLSSSQVLANNSKDTSVQQRLISEIFTLVANRPNSSCNFLPYDPALLQLSDPKLTYHKSPTPPSLPINNNPIPKPTTQRYPLLSNL